MNFTTQTVQKGIFNSKTEDAMHILLQKLDEAIDEMERGQVQTIDEVWEELERI